MEIGWSLRQEFKDEEWEQRLEPGRELWEEEMVHVLSIIHSETNLIQWKMIRP